MGKLSLLRAFLLLFFVTFTVNVSKCQLLWNEGFEGVTSLNCNSQSCGSYPSCLAGPPTNYACIPSGWLTKVDYPWKASNTAGVAHNYSNPTQVKYVTLSGWVNYRNQWLITNGTALTSGITYRLSFWFKTSNESCTNNCSSGFSFLVGASTNQTTLPTTTQVLNNGVNTSWQQFSYDYTPAADATYFFGINTKYTGYTTNNWAYMDDISLTQCSPGPAASNILFTNVSATSMDVSWTNGGGTARAVFMHDGTGGSASPVAGTNYTANSVFGSGTQIGTTGWYCVYNGTGNSVTISGLQQGHTYRVHVVEYNTGICNAVDYNSQVVPSNPADQSTTTSCASAINLSISGSNEICLGDTSLLTAAASSSNGPITGYLWYLDGIATGVQTSVLVTSDPGNYSVVVTDISGCTATANISVSSLPDPVAAFSGSINLNTVTFTNTSQNGTTYLWDFGDGSPVDVTADPVHTFLIDDTYTVTLVTSNGCGSDTATQQITITTTALIELNSHENLVVYPNPTSGKIVLSSQLEFGKEFSVALFRLDGKLVSRQQIHFSAGKDNLYLDLTEFAGGNYLLVVTGNDFTSRIPLQLLNN